VIKYSKIIYDYQRLELSSNCWDYYKGRSQCESDVVVWHQLWAVSIWFLPFPAQQGNKKFNQYRSERGCVMRCWWIENFVSNKYRIDCVLWLLFVRCVHLYAVRMCLLGISIFFRRNPLLLKVLQSLFVLISFTSIDFSRTLVLLCDFVFFYTNQFH